MTKYVFFDLDGTLTDPKVGITTCVQYALASFGIHEANLDQLVCYIGPPLVPAFQEFHGLTPSQAELALVKYRERFKPIGMFENVVYDGIPKMLEILKKQGKILAVATSKPEEFARKILERFELAPYFDEIVGSGLDGSLGTKQLVIEEALRRLNIQNKEDVLMIGDRKHDIIGARLAGIPCVGVLFGYGDYEELSQECPQGIVQTVQELTEYLSK